MSYYYKKYFYLKIKEIISYPILFVILRSLKFLSKLFYILYSIIPRKNFLYWKCYIEIINILILEK